MGKPVIALVGRPNVGKSALFNRLVGERLAIVDEIPGTTGIASWQADWSGYYFYVMDTGGIDPTKGKDRPPLSIGSRRSSRKSAPMLKGPGGSGPDPVHR